jgi:putative DNA primase/helicase
MQPDPGFDLGPRMISTKANQITPSRPEWLWERWLSKGALHLLVGRQGGGKSTFAAWVTAQVTTGRPFPDDLTDRDALNVATLSLEEADDRLVARLHAAGADVDRVDVLADVEDSDDEGRLFRRPWRLPKDCTTLESFLSDGNIRLLIVDGLGYSITGDSHNYAVIGSALSALAGVAERTGCAVLGLTHPPKGGSDPVTAAIGSTAWTAIPRVVWVLGADPSDETEQRRVCRVSKTNYRPPDNGLAFTIGNDERYECGFVTGLSMSAVSAEMIMAAKQTDGERSEREETRDLLASMLEAGPMDTADVLKSTRAAGISDTTVKRARRDLGVTSTARKDPTTGRTLGWALALPGPQGQPTITPEGQLLIDPLGPVGLNRTYRESRGPEDPQDQRGVDPVGFDLGPPPPDDDLFLDGESGF